MILFKEENEKFKKYQRDKTIPTKRIGRARSFDSDKKM